MGVGGGVGLGYFISAGILLRSYSLLLKHLDCRLDGQFPCVVQPVFGMNSPIGVSYGIEFLS